MTIQGRGQHIILQFKRLISPETVAVCRSHVIDAAVRRVPDGAAA